MTTAGVFFFAMFIYSVIVDTSPATAPLLALPMDNRKTCLSITIHALPAVVLLLTGLEPNQSTGELEMRNNSTKRADQIHDLQIPSDRSH